MTIWFQTRMAHFLLLLSGSFPSNIDFDILVGMFDEGQPVPHGVAVQELSISPEKGLEGEYASCVRVLNKTGIVSLLPQSEGLGVLGINGQEYEMPSLEQVGDILGRNQELVARKREQGFTKLQIIPFALPLATLVDRCGRAIVKHEKTGTIFQAKRKSSDPDIPVAVNLEEPVWMWDRLKGADLNGQLVYFPQSFDSSHHGVTKQDVIRKPDICAIPGWSVSLVNPSPFLVQEGKGRTIGGRHELETNRTPNEHLKALKDTQYTGETGLTPEDFLIKFATHLEETNQVSHDWDDNSAAWLLGCFQKDEARVPSANWRRDVQGVSVGADLPGGRNQGWGAPSTVRLA